MSEVKRWKLKGFLPGVDGECKAVFQPTVVMADDLDRVTAERDAALALIKTHEDAMAHVLEREKVLQQRLTAADQQIDDLRAELAAVSLGPCKMITGDELP